MPTHDDLYVLLVIIILVPVVPAYLLFKALPSRANVGGPFHGLEIKLGGAFAGYFLLVLLIVIELPRIKYVIDPDAEVWTVSGTLVDDKGNGLPIAPCDVQFMPPAAEGTSSGWFTATFTTVLGHQGVYFPILSVAHSGYPNEVITLRDQFHNSDRTIDLKQIVLKRPTEAYKPSGQAPAIVDPTAYSNATQNVVRGAP